MKAILFEQHGDAGVLQLRDAPVPRPGAGEVVIRVAYAGVNFADINLRKGTVPFEVRLPVFIGLEASGTVAAVGDGVASVGVGDRVACLALGNGAYAEYVRTSADHVFPLPPSIALDTAAAITLQGITAHHVLHDVVPVREGTVVLIHAAAGGMGLLLVQWARKLGAVVIGTVSTEEKARAAREAGAEHIIRYDREDFAAATLALTGGRGADYIVDGVGDATLRGDLAACAVHGTVAFYGWSSGGARLDPSALLERSVRIAGVNLGNAVAGASMAQQHAAAVFAAVEHGVLAPRVPTVLPLARARDAHQLVESRGSIGKVVLAVG